MKKKTKITITSISLAGLLFLYSQNDYQYVPKYSVIGENYNYWEAKYRDGNVYIVKKLSAIKKVNESDIIILDDRDENDPNMEIISSHEINDKEARNDIIEIILEYERRYPSKWNRTIESMRLEWYIHNILYDIDYERHRTDNVDFDNSDEEYYNKHILNKILKI